MEKENINLQPGFFIPHDDAIERNSYPVVFLWLLNLTNSDCFNRPIHEPLVRQASSLGVFVGQVAL